MSSSYITVRCISVARVCCGECIPEELQLQEQLECLTACVLCDLQNECGVCVSQSCTNGSIKRRGDVLVILNSLLCFHYQETRKLRILIMSYAHSNQSLGQCSESNLRI